MRRLKNRKVSNYRADILKLWVRSEYDISYGESLENYTCI